MRQLRILGLISIVIVSAVMVACSKPVQTATTFEPPKLDLPEKDAQELAAGNNDFAFDLHRQIAKSETGNIFFSPYSIRTALAMTYAGARSQTADEMRKVLRFTSPDETLHKSMGAVQTYFQTPAGAPYTINIANSLWGQKEYPFVPAFKDLCNQSYGGGFREVDYIGDTDGARKQINEWVEQKTEQRIKKILNDDDLSEDTRLVLANAIYFKGQWVHQFDKKMTVDMDFEIAEGHKIRVPMMQTKNSFPYFQNGKMQMIKLPYRGENLSMAIVLPVKRFGLQELEAELNADSLRQSIAKMKSDEVELYLPKFESETRIVLNIQLVNMGMPTAFSDTKADFTGMTTPERLKISKVIHKANLKVDEEGAVAAAATAVEMVNTSMPPPIPQFHADQPFLCMIIDDKTGMILFLGRIQNPKK